MLDYEMNVFSEVNYDLMIDRNEIWFVTHEDNAWFIGDGHVIDN